MVWLVELTRQLSEVLKIGYQVGDHLATLYQTCYRWWDEQLIRVVANSVASMSIVYLDYANAFLAQAVF